MAKEDELGDSLIAPDTQNTRAVPLQALGDPHFTSAAPIANPAPGFGSVYTAHDTPVSPAAAKSPSYDRGAKAVFDDSPLPGASGFGPVSGGVTGFTPAPAHPDEVVLDPYPHSEDEFEGTLPSSGSGVARSASLRSRFGADEVVPVSLPQVGHDGRAHGAGAIGGGGGGGHPSPVALLNDSPMVDLGVVHSPVGGGVDLGYSHANPLGAGAFPPPDTQENYELRAQLDHRSEMVWVMALCFSFLS